MLWLFYLKSKNTKNLKHHWLGIIGISGAANEMITSGDNLFIIFAVYLHKWLVI
jgi:energy-converting hydrogenase Eha subunit G